MARSKKRKKNAEPEAPWSYREWAEERAQDLTAAERRVFDLLLLGLTAQGIAKILGLSPFTVSNHTRRIFEVFEVNSRTSVMAFFLMPPPPPIEESPID